MEYYNKIEILGNVSAIYYGTSQKGISYANGFIQCYQLGEYNGKEIKKNYVSIKFTAFNEQADMINALGTQKGSELKISGFMKDNYYKKSDGTEINETILLVEKVYESFGEVNQENNTFFSTPKKPRSTNNIEDLDDDLPF